MFESIKFENFKTLRDTTLPLNPFTLIVGPNGSGKSTALNAFSALRQPGQAQFLQCRSVSAPSGTKFALTANWKEEGNNILVQVTWQGDNSFVGPSFRPIPASPQTPLRADQLEKPAKALNRGRFYSLDANVIAAPIQLQPDMELTSTGANLAGVLDRLRDKTPERFEALNEQLGLWIPEFNRILFETPFVGQRSIALRTRDGNHTIRANNLSQGTLIALALLTIAYLPDPPSIVCLEEPDRGLHPRLLRDLRDALYRLAYPEGSQEKRNPVQVVATTHNPYLLDLFREHPAEIVIAEKVGLESKFSRLSDRADLEEILGDAPLSEVWYSGVLGGVPAGT
ncbi:MAG: AAA family ATPase [Verrucomicrobiia bacterium]